MERPSHDFFKDYPFKVVRIRKSRASTDGNVFFIYAGTEKFVAKIYDNLQHTQTIIKIHNILYTSNIHVPRIITTTKGQHYVPIDAQHNLVVFSFIKGRKFKFNPSTNEIKSTAKLLRGMHAALQHHITGAPPLPFDYCDIGRNQVIHFDLTKSNILTTGSQFGIIDFDDAKYGPAALDVAIAVLFLFFSRRHGVNENGARLFIKEYYANDTDLRDKEVPHLKSLALSFIDWFIANVNSISSSIKQGFTERRELVLGGYLFGT